MGWNGGVDADEGIGNEVTEDMMRGLLRFITTRMRKRKKLDGMKRCSDAVQGTISLQVDLIAKE